MICLKVYGIERAGAGYLMEMLKQNVTDVTFLFSEFGKHNEMPKTRLESKLWMRKHKYIIQTNNIRILNRILNAQEKIYPLVIIKDPYSWSKSIWRYRSIKKIDYEKEYTYYNEFYEKHKELLTKANSLYDSLYAPGMFIRYEELIEKPFMVLARIRKFYKIERIGALKIPDVIKGSYKFNDNLKKYYLSTGPFKLSEININKITELVNWDVITNFYGYHPMNPLDYYDYSRQERVRLSTEMRKTGITKILQKYESHKRSGI